MQPLLFHSPSLLHHQLLWWFMSMVFLLSSASSSAQSITTNGQPIVVDDDDHKSNLNKNTGDSIRARFLQFYAARGHRILPSSSLVPEDPTVLLTIAGMLQFKPIFLGKVNPCVLASYSFHVILHAYIPFLYLYTYCII